MLKLLKLFIFGVVFVGIFAAAFLGFRVYMDLQSPEHAGEKSSEAAASSSSGDLASIAEDYRRSAEAAKMAPTGEGAQPVATPAKPVPTPDGSQKILREYATGRKLVALTFDDGPNTAFTTRFLDVLKAKDARATFFLLGPNVKSNPEIAKMIVDAGMEVGNHSWSHPTLNKLSVEKVHDEIEKTNEVIKASTGADVQLLRPPYGSANTKVQDICSSLGMTIINWNIDTNDWRSGVSADTITSEIMKNLRDGSIILMHDRYEHSLEATEQAIDQIKAKGYQIVTVGELLGYRPLNQVQVAGSSGASPAPAAQAEPTPASRVAAAGGSLPAPVVATSATAQSQAEVQPRPRTATLPAPSIQSGSPEPMVLPEVSADKLTQPPTAPSR